jgi:hypothetical protein
MQLPLEVLMKEAAALLIIGACAILLLMNWSESFTDKPVSTTAAAPPPGKRVIMEYDVTPTPAVNSLDDYEFNVVSGSDAEKEITKDLRSKLMSQRPMDWSGLPPDSSKFQAGLAESFQNASQTVPDDAKPYQDVNGGAMAPPDTDSQEMRERQMLQTYKPSKGEMTTYDEKDVDKLIENIYGSKGLIPTVAHKQNTNVYEVVGVRRKDEKIVYEGEEAPAATGPVQRAGEATIHAPAAAADMAASVDPYYDTTPGGRSRAGKWDYQAWTPGLERMFAPTEDKKNWY